VAFAEELLEIQQEKQMSYCLIELWPEWLLAGSPNFGCMDWIGNRFGWALHSGAGEWI
jgi:hypothetical protein